MISTNNPLPLHVKITERIIMRANELGLSQADIAKKVGARRSTVNGWFNGSAPRPKYIKALREVLRVSQDWLEGATASPFATNEHEFYLTLDRAWDLGPENQIKTNALLVPLFDQKGGNSAANSIVIPTKLVDHVADPRGLAFATIENESVIFNTVELDPGHKAKRFIVILPGNELAIALVRRDLGGDAIAQINKREFSINSNESVKIAGRCVCVICRY
jgi:transcriptional regulator with XRE-family HTH domain